MYPATPWYQLWWKAYTRPSMETFFEISVDAGAGMRRSFVWVFVTALISSLVAQAPEMLRDWPRYVAERQYLWPVIVPLLSVVFLWLSARLIQWGAGQILNVETQLPRLMACLAAIFAPAALLSGLFTLLGEITVFQVVCGLTILLFIYAIALEIIAIQAVIGASRSFAIILWLLSWLCLLPLTCLALAAFVMSNPGNVT
jgi:hypothetical protein